MFEMSPLKGSECLTNYNKVIEENFVHEFWGWCYSSLHNPIVRGNLAEYLVYKSLLGQKSNKFEVPENYFNTKVESDVHDLVFYFENEKFTIQVKSKDSASKDTRYKTSYAKGFDLLKNINTEEKFHWSDFYIFSYLELDSEDSHYVKSSHEKWNANNSDKTKKEIVLFKEAQERLVKSVLNVENWCFYIMKRLDLNEQKTITLNSLKTKHRLGKAIVCNYENIGLELKSLASKMCKGKGDATLKCY